MTALEEIEEKVASLPSKDFAIFCKWFSDFRESELDRRLDAAARAGKFDELARRAIEEDIAGESTPL